MSDAEERAPLAGGCFWGMQELIRALPGVTRVGHIGDADKPRATCRDRGKHAASIGIAFDPTVTGDRAILEGRPNRSTRTTSSATRTATPATSAPEPAPARARRSPSTGAAG